MSAGEVTQGSRRPDGTELHLLDRGEYAFASAATERALLWFCSPRGEHGAVDRTWAITEEPDGTVTVSPSIFWNREDDPPGWHGFLERGVWREV